MEYKLIKDWQYTGRYDSKGFIPVYADKNDLNLLNRFMEMQCAANYKDEIDLMFSDKTAFAKSSVINNISQIKERMYLRDRNIGKIDYDICSQRNRLLQLEDLFTNGTSPITHKLKNDIERTILESEKEKRDQEVSCWRDIALLRKDLMLGMNYYKTNSRKKQLISGIDVGAGYD